MMNTNATMNSYSGSGAAIPATFVSRELQNHPSAHSAPVYFRISELATSPETTARIYTDPQGQVRHIKAKHAHKGITPLGKSTILKWCKEGRFPAPIRHLPGMTLWSATEVYQWLADLNNAANDGVA